MFTLGCIFAILSRLQVAFRSKSSLTHPIRKSVDSDSDPPTTLMTDAAWTPEAIAGRRAHHFPKLSRVGYNVRRRVKLAQRIARRDERAGSM